MIASPNDSTEPEAIFAIDMTKTMILPGIYSRNAVSLRRVKGVRI